MSRRLDFRQQCDELVPGVGHKLTNIIVRVDAAIARLLTWLSRIEFPPPANSRHAPGADLGEFGVFLDFDAPALVVGKVQMEAVELVSSHPIDVGLHFVHREEVPGDVQRQTAPREPRPIGNLHAGYVPVHTLDQAERLDFRRQELQQGLHAIEEPGDFRGTDDHTLRRDCQHVPFDSQSRTIAADRQVDAATVGHPITADVQMEACSRRNSFGEDRADFPGVRIRVRDHRVLRKRERAIVWRHTDRLRDDGREW